MCLLLFVWFGLLAFVVVFVVVFVVAFVVVCVGLVDLLGYLLWVPVLGCICFVFVVLYV